MEIADLNQNGLPEIILNDGGESSRGNWDYVIDEWNGRTFVNLALNPENGDEPEIFGPEKFELKDMNQDGLKDLVLTGDIPGSCCGEAIPWRLMTVVYSWNGNFFGQTYKIFAPPQYRFQAVQDGDREILYGNYQQALSFYQDAIFSNHLGWWSPERKKYETHLSEYQPTPTIYPTPIPDLTESPRLAAYAYYRIIILHTFLGEMDEAQVKYATLQEKFPVGNLGHPYVEMATYFWNDYQSSGKIYNACAAAIAYANTHPEILIPLGSDYHGAQSHIYQPADVCPFR